ncbi:hypothetical protein EDC96DRAFT_548954 [Choanephora cucurbitarum]|nr:hypothetical protein EDC96DRAFT_548954 [Choanephora cucurbitarum]
MSNKRSSCSTSVGQARVKKIRINGLSKNYKFLKWVEASLQRSPPGLEYFSFAEQFEGTEEATNTNYKDLLLTLQSHQSNRLTSIAHSAETTSNTRRNKNSVFGKQYMNCWENRKDQALEKDINNDARTTISSIQQMVNQNIREKAKNAFCRSSSSSEYQSSGSDSPSSDSLALIPLTLHLLALHLLVLQLLIYLVGHLNIIDLSSDSVVETLKEHITEEEYLDIACSLKTDQVKLSKNANELIKAIKSIKSFSYRTLRNTLYKHGYQFDHDPIAEFDTGIVESLVQHFLDLIESPNNPLNSKTLERTAAVHTSIIIINRLFLSVNDIIELGWLEREYYATQKAKWDGVLFKVDDHKISPGFVEFSGGTNSNTTLTKERHDIKKLYSKIIDVISQYPPNIRKSSFCIRFYENTIFFEELSVYKKAMFRIQHVAVRIPTTVRLLIKFTDEIPKIIAWRNAVVKHVEQF